MAEPGAEDFRRLIQDYMRDAPTLPPAGEPPDKFAHLNPETRSLLERMDPATLQWLTRMRPEDMVLHDEMLARMRSWKTLSKFGRAFVVTMVGCLIAGLTLGEKLGTAWKWATGIFGGGK